MEISAICTPLANATVMNTLTVGCLWLAQTARERTGNLPSYAKSKKNEVANALYPRLPLEVALTMVGYREFKATYWQNI